MKRKLAAILVADVVGYSRLTADDEEATLRRLEVFRTIWQDCLAKTGGRIFNTAGDAILAEFRSGVEAVRCALDFQAQAKAQNDGMVPQRQMHFRIGITIGDVVERRGDLLGDGVNIAARLQTLAGPGGVCVSSWVREAVANKIGVKFTDLGDQNVKNIPTPIRAYLVGASAGAAAVAGASSQRKQDWLSRAASSWQGMALVLGLASAGMLGAFLLVSQLRPGKPDAASTRGAAAPLPGDPGDLSRDTVTTRPAPPAPAPPPVTPVKATEPQPPLAPTADPVPAKAPPSQPIVVPVPPVAQPPTKTTRPVDQGAATRFGPLTEAAEGALKSGERFRECENCPEMVAAPRGDFVMGSPDGQAGAERDEMPARKVAIGSPIAAARFAVTVVEFETFIAITGYRPAPGCRVYEGSRWVDKPELSFRNPGFPQSPDHPVVCINWNDAKAYTDWMSARTGTTYRLPTEAEREFFTRAGTTSLFWWGNDIEPSRAGYDWSHAFGSGPRGETRRGTHPVQSFQPNPWGLYQVHGNVSEWVEDCWNDGYRGAPVDGAAWTTGDCKRRVLRGGSWGYSPKDLRAAYREGATATYRNFNFGFRVVRVLRGAK